MRILIKSFFIFSFYLTLMGCRQPVQSQQSQSQQLQRTVSPSRDQAASNMSNSIDNSRQTAITRAVQVVSPAVVSVNVTEVQTVRDSPFNDPFFENFFGGGRTYQQEVKSIGSGFLISPDGYIVTNDHVAGDAVKITVAFSDGTNKQAKLIGTDKVTDVALLKIETDKPLPYLSFANSDQTLVGEWAVALGNPFGLFESTQPTVTVGVISGTNRNLSSTEGHSYRSMIQTDAAINQGNSGGPLVNALGEVVGMNTVIYSRSGGSVGVGFAVPANKVRQVVDELKRNGKVERSIYTGLYVRDTDAYTAQRYGLKSLVFVESLDKNSPAAQAGFKINDVLLKINGEKVRNREEASLQLANYRAGDTIKFVVWRNGAEQELTMTLAKQ